jgi:hypothetical protein
MCLVGNFSIVFKCYLHELQTSGVNQIRKLLKYQVTYSLLVVTVSCMLYLSHFLFVVAVMHITVFSPLRVTLE